MDFAEPQVRARPTQAELHPGWLPARELLPRFPRPFKKRPRLCVATRVVLPERERVAALGGAPHHVVAIPRLRRQSLPSPEGAQEEVLRLARALLRVIPVGERLQ